MAYGGSPADSLGALGVKAFSGNRDPVWRWRYAPGMSVPLAAVIVLGAAALVGLAFVLLDRAAAKPLVPEAARGGPTLIVTGTLFAVLLAFVTLAAFQTYNGAKTGAASEADAVLDMARTANLFRPHQRDQLRADLVCYGRAVVDQEWPAMRAGHPSPVVDYWIGAYRALFGSLTLNSPREQLGFQDLLNLANTRTAGRQQRLSQATPSVPTPLWGRWCLAVASRWRFSSRWQDRASALTPHSWPGTPPSLRQACWSSTSWTTHINRTPAASSPLRCVGR